VAKWNPLALKLLMWVMGVLIVMGSGLGFSASVAGVAFGAGIMIAGFDPIANVSWVRALVLYAILEIVWQIFSVISVGKFDLIPFIIGILVAVLAVVLYPNKPALWMQGVKTGIGARA
jgi:hypothetical protein